MIYFAKNGVNSISDDDELYLTGDNDDVNNGIFTMQVNANFIHTLLYEALKQVPDIYDTKLFNELLYIHSGASNFGTCCNNEFRSNVKKLVCPNCGKIVSLT